eukprot:5430093-Amphidinium_carterae.1
MGESRYVLLAEHGWQCTTCEGRRKKILESWRQRREELESEAQANQEFHGMSESVSILAWLNLCSDTMKSSSMKCGRWPHDSRNLH